MIIKFIFKLFGGKAKAAIWSVSVMAALFIVAKVSLVSPELAAKIDPTALAGFIAASIFALINIVTNHVHNKNLDELNQLLQEARNEPVSIPVQPAQPVPQTNGKP